MADAQPRILVFAGSLRTESFNHKLVVAASKGAEQAGAIVTIIRLREFQLPLYDQEIEDHQGLPENCLKLKELFKAHHGFLIGCPEYNSSISGVLKNTIDWVSRPHEGDAPLECFDRKVIGLTAASPGGLGGIRGLPIERMLFGHIKAIVLPDQYALAGADKAFDDDGNLKDDKQRSMAEGVGKAVAEVAARVGKVTA
ncbi:NADPH-dependent FMN reductase [Leptolyngbya valderiana BDU 20041]|nr:NADPH-dependent FMN reductase [Leptolyngbya valderiana BDU 20041]